ncbi:MAG TPA: FmdE family protein [Patescibacteria group bacterium]|nr:FmdE family protein [Patescibacteria group bacterium]
MIKGKMMVLLSVFCLLYSVAFAAPAQDSYSFWTGVSRSAAVEAWRLIGEKPAELIVLTNAGYAVCNGQSTAPCLDGLTEATGCTEGRNNLLEVHSSRENALWFAFFDKKSGKCAYIEVNRAATWQKSDENARQKNLFSKMTSANIGMEELLAYPSVWNEKVKEKIFNGKEFAIAGFCNAAVQGAPQDFLKAALYHDHLCPGVNSGYFIVNYLVKEMPLASVDERYYIIASPHWCKDDALQTLLNTTPGKSGMAVIPVSGEMKAKLIPEAKNMAGIFIRWNEKEKRGEGRVLAFDFNAGTKLAGFEGKEGFPWERRLKMNSVYQYYYDQPEIFVSTIKTFELANGERPEDYAKAGVNPLEKLKLLQP